MPRPGPRRPIVCVRLDEETIAKLEAAARRGTIGLSNSDGVGPHLNRSDIIRAAIAAYLKS